MAASQRPLSTHAGMPTAQQHMAAARVAVCRPRQSCSSSRSRRRWWLRRLQTAVAVAWQSLSSSGFGSTSIQRQAMSGARPLPYLAAARLQLCTALRATYLPQQNCHSLKLLCMPLPLLLRCCRATCRALTASLSSAHGWPAYPAGPTCWSESAAAWASELITQFTPACLPSPPICLLTCVTNRLHCCRHPAALLQGFSGLPKCRCVQAGQHPPGAAQHAAGLRRQRPCPPM